MPKAIITAVGGYVPEKVLSNKDLEKIMETNDEWITSRTGIRERRVMPDGKAVSDIGHEVVEQLLRKTGTDRNDIDLLICATCTSDYILPDAANTICYKSGLERAFAYDLNAACSGFIFALYTGSQFIKSGAYKKVIVIGAEKLTPFMNYADRTTSILFGDGGGGVLLEASEEPYGVIDAVLRGDGEGAKFLRIEAGGSLHPITEELIKDQKHKVTQDGKNVFKRAVMGMSSTINAVLERNNLSASDIRWVIPHQANLRIINAVADMIAFPMDRITVNIEKYGNTSAGTIPLCLWEFEQNFAKGDHIMLTAFGGGFTWGSLLLRWAY
jgi:3-oxoacyl-[acyl-carrier-protein] synthase-3